MDVGMGENYLDMITYRYTAAGISEATFSGNITSGCSPFASRLRTIDSTAPLVLAPSVKRQMCKYVATAKQDAQ